MCQFLGKTNNFEFFGPNLPQNRFRAGNSESECQNKNQYLGDTMCASFYGKGTTLPFLAQIYPKMILGVENLET